MKEEAKMNKQKAIFLVISESIGVIAVIWLWTRKRKASLVSRLLWSLFLLIPLFGPLFYAFVKVSPDDHGETLPEYPDPGSY